MAEKAWAEKIKRKGGSDPLCSELGVWGLYGPSGIQDRDPNFALNVDEASQTSHTYTVANL